MSKTHEHTKGHKQTQTYYSWSGMKARCSNPKHKSYYGYGGRGISYYKAWESFETFLADMGERPEGTSLDRIDSSADYSPTNCRWATVKEQARNRSNNRYITANGKTQCMQAWAEELGVPQASLSYRINKGWSDIDAINKPFLPTQQTAEARPSTKFITHDGLRMSVSAWARHFGIPVARFSARLRRGWTLERARQP